MPELILVPSRFAWDAFAPFSHSQATARILEINIEAVIEQRRLKFRLAMGPNFGRLNRGV
jgi:hypothetical protein